MTPCPPIRDLPRTSGHSQQSSWTKKRSQKQETYESSCFPGYTDRNWRFWLWLIVASWQWAIMSQSVQFNSTVSIRCQLPFKWNITQNVYILPFFQGDQCWKERAERGPGLLWGSGGEKETNELLSLLHAQQDPHRQETQLLAQRRGPWPPDGVQQNGRGRNTKTKTHSDDHSRTQIQIPRSCIYKQLLSS